MTRVARAAGLIRRLAATGIRRAGGPLRRLVGSLIRRHPGLGPRLGQWSWLWQPSWSRTHHERFYAAGPDPYGFEQPAEQRKYEETLTLLPGRYARALEVGASEGAFTQLLADRCDAVVATDVSRVALERARIRLAGREEVSLERRTLPFDSPEGTFDLIVCSDVLYLWEAETLTAGLERLAARLRPGGTWLLLHYLGEFGAPLSADQVHGRALAMAPALGLRLAHSTQLDYRGPHGSGYRADILVRPLPPASVPDAA